MRTECLRPDVLQRELREVNERRLMHTDIRARPLYGKRRLRGTNTVERTMGVQVLEVLRAVRLLPPRFPTAPEPKLGALVHHRDRLAGFHGRVIVTEPESIIEQAEDDIVSRSAGE